MTEDAELAAYQPGEQLFLWWLGQPAQPRLIGELRQVRALKSVSLRYGADWLRRGFALSEDLPLRDHEFLPAHKECAAGAVDDARPDRWGERVIRVLDKPPRLALLDFLFYAGDERFGALGVSVSASAYRPRRIAPLPRLGELAAVEQLVRRILAGEAVEAPERRLIAPGVSLGGARPKALIELDGAPWVLKFGEPGEAVDNALIEHASLRLAAQAGIEVAATRALPLAQGHALAVRRFDRAEAGRRVHALSAQVALRAAGEPMGYPELAQLLRRRGVSAQRLHQTQMRELFRRMVFNILLDNTDDHEKKHVLLLADSGEYRLSPAFDVRPSGQALGYQQMRVGAQEADSTLDNALSECRLFGLTPEQGRAEIGRVCAVVDTWRAQFAALGVSARDIEALAAQIDRPFLRQQREAWRPG